MSYPSLLVACTLYGIGCRSIKGISDSHVRLETLDRLNRLFQLTSQSNLSLAIPEVTDGPTYCRCGTFLHPLGSSIWLNGCWKCNGDWKEELLHPYDLHRISLEYKIHPQLLYCYLAKGFYNYDNRENASLLESRPANQSRSIVNTRRFT